MVPELNQSRITRFEVIDYSKAVAEGGGRTYVAYGKQIELDFQDKGRTLKVFISERPDTPLRSPNEE